MNFYIGWTPWDSKVCSLMLGAHPGAQKYAFGWWVRSPGAERLHFYSTLLCIFHGALDIQEKQTVTRTPMFLGGSKKTGPDHKCDRVRGTLGPPLDRLGDPMWNTIGHYEAIVGYTDAPCVEGVCPRLSVLKRVCPDHVLVGNIDVS